MCPQAYRILAVSTPQIPWYGLCILQSRASAEGLASLRLCHSHLSTQLLTFFLKLHICTKHGSDRFGFLTLLFSNHVSLDNSICFFQSYFLDL